MTHWSSALKRDAIVHRVLDFLRAVEVARCSGQVLVPEQSLNLLQFAAGLAAELGARAAQIMRAKIGRSPPLWRPSPPHPKSPTR